ncbi:hypothetical protein Suden_1664 [Sulfurimonas denitrificans DSM 1251]|uniref:Uncharacterized protein n=1 Tax=Sulfurimonas denitrificans (strain ATCC 33889 / DSM 1251) TaxID=326298 RepID=Q30PZ0_SULDN|nr:hypothetical protein [Sulfurimonas denitrificans]ABB44941.1 hypothetical protein Suden_1664 [Sulfurimonas denitrificans DSM 1251]MDD3442657.1 hypothetical protein [Sulfurimonas denitrificans]
MLTNSIWRQYNSENNFRELLANFCKISEIDLIEDDKNLYNVLKAKLTKKELKLFAMDSASISDESIKKEFECNDDELKNAKFKLYKKLKQDKVRLSFKASSVEDFA